MKKLTVLLFLLTTFITVCGILIIFSTSANFAYERFGDTFYFVKRQTIWFIIGLILQFAVMKIGYKKLFEFAPLLFGIGILFLVLVLIPGISLEIGGARRWLRLGPVGVQPSEPMKVVFVIFMAWFLTKNQEYIKDLKRGYLVPLGILVFVLVLILGERDLGTSIIIGFVIYSMFLVAGMRKTYLFSFAFSAIPVLVFSIYKYPFRMKRIMAFLDPWSDPQNTSYQIIQSLVAISSGGWFGKGFGEGIQKYYYLPEAHTDFIFSIYAEETGFFGCLLLLGLFMALFICCMKITVRAKDDFGYLLAFGLTTLLVVQVIINIGVTTSLLPTKGTPLPFVSFGGSSLVVNMIAIGILVSIGRHSRIKI